MQPVVCELTRDGLTYNRRKKYIEPAVYTVFITRYLHNYHEDTYPSYGSNKNTLIFIKNRIYYDSKKIIWILFLSLKIISHTSE